MGGRLGGLPRRRLLQGVVLVGAVVALPTLISMLLPGAAPYMPPAVVLLLVVLSCGYAALVWRTRHVLAWLFPGCAVPTPLLTATERTAANLSAWTGLAVSLLLVLRWVWGAV